MISLVYTCIQEQRGREKPSLAGVIRKARRHAKPMSNPPLAGVMPYLWKARKAVTNANKSKPNVSKSKPNVSKSKLSTRKSLSNTIKSLLSQLHVHVDTSILNMSKRASATVL